MELKFNEISLSFVLQLVIMIKILKILLISLCFYDILSFQYIFKMLIMIAICKTNDNEISLNFNSI